ncbi:type VII toxin-antitoxin system MntA family adenylyltransferase antitoxin [Halonotius pteroides]|uniref:Nucleotidyltransferase domain-containing protein n=1 Tax=Halonotius pteroides TaxID=268735 RepID=A0A3A6Q950_9EURY|nr:nucleotidyltransferase domain-containing protein [Halonotius pteroides]RJX49359.1 nucleotidyltransferase domain-containing protein [Halonotius pteroides]
MTFNGLDEPVADAVRDVLADQPVRLGVLFGSLASGTAGSHSDVDIAVEFESDVTDADRYRARLSLVVALSQALGTDDFDLVDLETVRPEVGRSALEDCIVLVGDTERVTHLLAAFERRAEPPTADQRRARFDAALEGVEERV